MSSSLAPVFLTKNNQTIPSTVGQSIHAFFQEKAEVPHVQMEVGTTGVTLTVDAAGCPLWVADNMEAPGTFTGNLAIGMFALCLNPAGEVLIIQRKDNNMWHFPGGLMGLGETARQTLKSKVAQKTGLQISDYDQVIPLSFYESRFSDGTVTRHNLMAFCAVMCSDTEGLELVCGSDVLAARWIKPGDFWAGYSNNTIPSMSSIKGPLDALTDHLLGFATSRAARPVSASI